MLVRRVCEKSRDLSVPDMVGEGGTPYKISFSFRSFKGAFFIEKAEMKYGHYL